MDDGLYQSLTINIKSFDLKKDEKILLLNFIAKASTATKQKIFELILHEYFNNADITDENRVPYNGVIVNNDTVSFNLADFPIRLRRILFKFMQIVESNENEDYRFRIF